MALSVTFNAYTFDKQSAEVSFKLYVIDILKNELGRARGTVTSGSLIGTNPAGVANTSLGSWTYTPSAAKP